MTTTNPRNEECKTPVAKSACNQKVLSPNQSQIELQGVISLAEVYTWLWRNSEVCESVPRLQASSATGGEMCSEEIL